MKKIIASCCFVIALLFSCENDNEIVTPTTSFDVQKLRSEFINQIEIPATTSFTESVTSLNAAIINFTDSPSEVTLSNLKIRWKQSAKDFTALEILTIGAVKTSLIMTSFYTWGTNEIAITNYIESTNPITNADINSQSTTMRGLSAVEFLLFEKTPAQTIIDFSNERRKQYLLVLGENLVDKTATLNTTWTNYRATFISNNQTGINGGVNMLVNQMNALLENVRRFKLGEPAGLEVKDSPDASLLQAEKSNYSLELIKENIASVKKTYFDTAHSLDNYVEYITKSNAINAKIKNQFIAIENDLTVIASEPLKDAISTKPVEVEKLYNDIRSLLVLIKIDVASALSITITFTDNDGD